MSNSEVSNDTYFSTNHFKYTVDNRIYQWHLRRFQDRLFEMISATEPQTLLDAGCGEGFIVKDLLQRDPSLRITGVDLSEEAIAYAREYVGDAARFRTGSLYKLPFSDNAFDTVLCSEVLEHLDEPDRAVAELKRVARNYVIITVPREPYFQKLNDLGQMIGVGTDPGHVNFWTAKTFQEWIRSHFDAPEFAWKHIYQLASAKV